MKKVIAAAVAVLMCAASAMAGLEGTSMTVSITHDQFTPMSSLANASYTYGDSSMFTVPGWGSLTVSSPAVAPGMANAMNIDFTNFAYGAFVAPFPAMGTLTLNNLAEAPDLSSVKLLVNGLDVALATAPTASGFQVMWSAVSVFNGNPINPNMTVAWNSVPAPGALALLGLAGVVAATRRRKT